MDKALKNWFSSLKDNWGDVYLVGGGVRDLLLSRPTNDIDLVCQNAQAFAKKLAAEHNAAMIPFEKKADEPCYRVVDRKDTNNFLDIVSIKGNSIVDDLKLRDFTLNAMAIHLEKDGTLGKLIDPLNGATDINKKKIRLIQKQALSSDPLRILRGVRLAAELEFLIEENTLVFMREKAERLQMVSFERITAELIKLLKTQKSAAFFRLMDNLTVLDNIFPEIVSMKTCHQNAFHHLNVWDHSMVVMENCEYILNHLQGFFGDNAEPIEIYLKGQNRKPLLKLAALLHDVGKPQTKSVNEKSGRISFYSHDKKGEKIIQGISERLKMSRKQQTFLATLVAEHLHVLAISKPEAKITTKMRWFRKFADDSIPIIILSIADVNGTLGPDSDEAYRNNQVQWLKGAVAAYYGDIKKRLKRRDFVHGKDLLALGMPPGPQMGLLLKRIRDAQDQNLIKNKKEALAFAQQHNVD